MYEALIALQEKVPWFVNPTCTCLVLNFTAVVATILLISYLLKYIRTQPVISKGAYMFLGAMVSLLISNAINFYHGSFSFRVESGLQWIPEYSLYSTIFNLVASVLIAAFVYDLARMVRRI